MSPEFATAVDPVLTYVLSVMDQIESGRPLEPEDVSRRVRGLMDQAENRLGQSPDWTLAKYALAAWVDDLLIEHPWGGRAWWEDNRLEYQLFRTAVAFTTFYARAGEATSRPNKDALEVFYVCVVLGFRGLYGDPNAAEEFAKEYGLPRSIDQWARRTSETIQLGQGRPRLIEQSRPGGGAPPLEGKYLLIGTGLFFLISLVATGIVAWQVFFRE